MAVNSSEDPVTTTIDRKAAGVQKKEAIPDRSEVARSPIEWTLQELDSLAQFHGVAYINVTPLLYPGGQQIRGAYQLHAFNDHDVEERTHFRSVALDAVRQVFGFAPSSDAYKKLRQSSMQLSANSNNASTKRTAVVKAGGKDDGGSTIKQQHGGSNKPDQHGRHNNPESAAMATGTAVRVASSADNISAGLPSHTNVQIGGSAQAAAMHPVGGEVSRADVINNNSLRGGSQSEHHMAQSSAAGPPATGDSQADEQPTNKPVKSGSPRGGGGAHDAASHQPTTQYDGGISSLISTFDEYKTYITIDIQLYRPLVARRETEELAAQVAAYLPQRGAFPPIETDSKTATTDFRDTVNHCVQTMISDYVDMLLQSKPDTATETTNKTDKKRQTNVNVKEQGEASDIDQESGNRSKSHNKPPRWRKPKPNADDDDAVEDQLDPALGFGALRPIDRDNSNFLHMMNTSGKFGMLKDALKTPLLKLMKFRFPKAVDMRDDREREDFALRLYVFLVDEMRGLLEDIFRDNLEDVAPSKALLNIGPEQIKIFADEAEITSNFPLALKYHQQRIALDDGQAQYWFEYAALLLRMQRVAEAEECLREALRLNRKHFATLLTLGYIAMQESKFPMAETLFEACTAFHPKSIIAWCMMGLFYEKLGDPIAIERAFYNAKRTLTKVRDGAKATTASPRRWNIANDFDAGLTADEATTAVLAKEKLPTTLNNDNYSVQRFVSNDTGGGGTDDKSAGEKIVTTNSKDAGKQKQQRMSPPQSAAVADQQRASGLATDKQQQQQSLLATTTTTGAAAQQSFAVTAAASVPPPPTVDAGSKKASKKSAAGAATAAAAAAQLAAVVTESDSNSNKAGGGGGRKLPTAENVTNSKNSSDISIFHMTLEFLLRVHAYPLVEQCLSHMMLDSAVQPADNNSETITAESDYDKHHFFISAARLALARADYDEAEHRLKQALQMSMEDGFSMALLGHVHYLRGEFVVALEKYEWGLRIKTADVDGEFVPPEMHAVMLRYADICMQLSTSSSDTIQYDSTKRAYLQLSRAFPTCHAWLGVGIACYRLGELRNAENALAEANILDHLDWRPWAYLTLICLNQDRFWEAEETFIQAIKCGMPDGDPIMDELRQHLDSAGIAYPTGNGGEEPKSNNTITERPRGKKSAAFTVAGTRKQSQTAAIYGAGGSTGRKRRPTGWIAKADSPTTTTETDTDDAGGGATTVATYDIADYSSSTGGGETETAASAYDDDENDGELDGSSHDGMSMYYSDNAARKAPF